MLKRTYYIFQFIFMIISYVVGCYLYKWDYRLFMKYSSSCNISFQASSKTGNGQKKNVCAIIERTWIQALTSVPPLIYILHWIIDGVSYPPKLSSSPPRTACGHLSVYKLKLSLLVWKILSNSVETSKENFCFILIIRDEHRGLFFEYGFKL